MAERVKTLQEYKKELEDRDQVELIDLLEITSPDLVDRFDDKVEDVYENLEEEDL
jgi:hypothetical protein